MASMTQYNIFSNLHYIWSYKATILGICRYTNRMICMTLNFFVWIWYPIIIFPFYFKNIVKTRSSLEWVDWVIYSSSVVIHHVRRVLQEIALNKRSLMCWYIISFDWKCWTHWRRYWQYKSLCFYLTLPLEDFQPIYILTYVGQCYNSWLKID